MMMHRPEAKKVSEISVEDTILTLLGNMCRQEGSMGRWRGIYELEACDSELALSTRKNCTQGQQFFLARSPGPSRRLIRRQRSPLPGVPRLLRPVLLCIGIVV